MRINHYIQAWSEGTGSVGAVAAAVLTVLLFMTMLALACLVGRRWLTKLAAWRANRRQRREIRDLRFATVSRSMEGTTITIKEACRQWEVNCEQFLKWQRRTTKKEANPTKQHYNTNWFGGEGNSEPGGILEVPLTMKQLEKQVEGLMATVRNHDDKINRLEKSDTRTVDEIGGAWADNQASASECSARHTELENRLSALEHGAKNPHEFAGSYWNGRQVRHLHSGRVGTILEEIIDKSDPAETPRRTFMVSVTETLDHFIRNTWHEMWRANRMEFVHPDKDPMEDLRGALDRAKRRIKELECFRAEAREEMANRRIEIDKTAAFAREIRDGLKRLEERVYKPLKFVSGVDWAAPDGDKTLAQMQDMQTGEILRAYGLPSDTFDQYPFVFKKSKENPKANLIGKQVKHILTGRYGTVVKEVLDNPMCGIREFVVKLPTGNNSIGYAQGPHSEQWLIDEFEVMSPAQIDNIHPKVWYAPKEKRCGIEGCVSELDHIGLCINKAAFFHPCSLNEWCEKRNCHGGDCVKYEDPCHHNLWCTYAAFHKGECANGTSPWRCGNNAWCDKWYAHDLSGCAKIRPRR